MSLTVDADAAPPLARHRSSSPAGRAARRAGDAIRAVFRAMRHRREVALLLELDDRTLKDIGLLRTDVSGALDAPWSTDPSVWLRRRAPRRRETSRG